MANPTSVVIVGRRLHDHEVVAVVDELRELAGHFGEVQEAAGTVWWTGPHARASISRRDDRSEVRVERLSHRFQHVAAAYVSLLFAIPVAFGAAWLAYNAGYGPAVQTVLVIAALALSVGGSAALRRRAAQTRAHKLDALVQRLRDRFGVSDDGLAALGAGSGEAIAVPALSEALRRR